MHHLMNKSPHFSEPSWHRSCLKLKDAVYPSLPLSSSFPHPPLAVLQIVSGWLSRGELR